MRSRLWALVATMALAAACSGDGTSASSNEPSPSPSLRKTTAIIDADETILLTVEVADTEEQRQRGLMFRESLGADEGMVFLFFEPSTGGFWMKSTLIPLSIAFFDRNGVILSILDMDPCEKDPCKLYDPGVPYFGALEVNQSSFEEWGVEEGDRIRLNQ